MSVQSGTFNSPQHGVSSPRVLQWLGLLAMLYLLLVSVSMIGSGFKWAVGEQAKELFAFASNPVAGLMIGIVGTALIQSSSYGDGYYCWLGCRWFAGWHGHTYGDGGEYRHHGH